MLKKLQVQVMTYLTHFMYIHIDSFVTYGWIERFREQAVLYMKWLFILIPTLSQLNAIGVVLSVSVEVYEVERCSLCAYGAAYG
jgi:hypothetical protein